MAKGRCVGDMSAAQLRSAARAGDAQEVARMLDGQFKGTHTSRRLESLGACIRQLLREHERRHTAEPESVPKFMTLEVLEDEYRRANDGAVLRPLDYGFRQLTPLLEAIPTCTLTYPGDGVTTVKPAVRSNPAAYNIAGGIPEARLRLPVNATDSKGRSPLWWAAKEGHEEVVKLLLDRNAAAEVCEHGTGNSALLMASVGGHLSVVEMLLKYSANPNTVNRKGNTAIMVAQSQQVVQALIMSGGDATRKNFVKKPGVSGGAVHEPQVPGGPPRRHTVLEINRMKATGRKVGNAGVGACEMLSPFKCGPPGVERGIHFGSDRSEIAVWGSDTLPRQERSAAEIQWSLRHKGAARFLEFHKTPQHSEKQATKLLAAGDLIGAAEAATVGLASIANSKRALLSGSKVSTKQAPHAEYRQLETVQQKLNDLLARCRSIELRSALRRMKVSDLLKLNVTTATALVEDRRWMPMGNRGTSERVEQHHIDTALAVAEDVEDKNERQAAQKVSMIEALLERHHVMLVARMAAAGQRDEVVAEGHTNADRATPVMVNHGLGTRQTAAQLADIDRATHNDEEASKGMLVRGMPAWN